MEEPHLGLAGAVPADLRAERAGRGAEAAVLPREAARRRAARGRSSRRASASTRCGRRSTGSSTSPTRGSTPAASGTMGFSIPAAIGAKVGRPDRTVWAVDGDGCFQMTAQELVTASVERIPIKVGAAQQQLPRHGPPVAGDVLRRALLRGVPVARHARLRALGRGDGLRRHPRRVARGGRAGDREGQLDQRPPGRRRVPRRLRTRRCSRWSRPGEQRRARPAAEPAGAREAALR